MPSYCRKAWPRWPQRYLVCTEKTPLMNHEQWLTPWRTTWHGEKNHVTPRGGFIGDMQCQLVSRISVQQRGQLFGFNGPFESDHPGIGKLPTCRLLVVFHQAICFKYYCSQLDHLPRVWGEDKKIYNTTAT